MLFFHHQVPHIPLLYSIRLISVIHIHTLSYSPCTLATERHPLRAQDKFEYTE